MRSNNSSGCLTAVVSSFSRIMLLFAWIARPALMDATFGTFIIPCLGFLFLPFTTLMYVFLKQGVGTIQGLDWLWLFLAVILDLASVAGAGAANRNRIPAGYPGSYDREGVSGGASACSADCGDTACTARPPRPRRTSRRNRSRNKLRTHGADRSPPRREQT